MQELIRGVERVAAETEFWGVVSMFRGDSEVFSKAFGYRDSKNRLRNTIDTRFGVASGTKLVTALGIGVLIDQGRLSLDTTVGEIDREYSGFVDERATILHLLTHTSGIFDYYDEEVEQDFDQPPPEIQWAALQTPSDYYPMFRAGTMKFRPGERYSYSNGGYVFLGILVERLAGGLYRDFVSEHVLLPARMQQSGFYSFDDLPPNTANGYLADRRTTNIYRLPPRGGGDGGMYTSTGDLQLLWDSLFSGRILSGELTATYLKTHQRRDDTRGYGCGVYKRLDDSMFWIVGSDAGVGFDSRYVVADKLTVNILSNITDGEEDVREVILQHL